MAATAGERQPMLERQNSRTSQRSWGRQTSHFAIPEAESYEAIHGGCETKVKNDFIKKVYSLLCIEIFWTGCISAVFCLYEPLRTGTVQFVTKHTLLYQILMLASLFATICALMMKKNEYPANYQVMFAFVTVMGVNIGVVCAIFYAAGKGMAIMQAVFVTAAIFLSLTAYAHITKSDFSFMGGFLICALFANMIFGIIAFYSGSTWGSFLYHVIGVLIFCGFILYDTAALIHKYGCDDYIIASIELYLDIVNLFLHILALLGDR